MESCSARPLLTPPGYLLLHSARGTQELSIYLFIVCLPHKNASPGPPLPDTVQNNVSLHVSSTISKLSEDRSSVIFITLVPIT